MSGYRSRISRTGGAARGFTMLELLVVLGIIGIMATVALPAVLRYLRVYKIRGTATQVAGDIQVCRNRAIAKNVNYGVVFVTLSNNTYQGIIEDDLEPPVTGERVALTTILTSDTYKQRRLWPQPQELPPGITFATGCTGFTANAAGFRFNRMGIWCSPGATGCPSLTVGTNQIMNDATNGATVCLLQASTGLKQVVQVAPGGRVRVVR